MTFKEVAHLRLLHQQLGTFQMKSAEEMVTWLGAVQAQEYSATKWGLGLRLPHLKDKDIEEELTKGVLLRTHVLRPTWHLVAAKDLRWLLQLTAPRVHAANAYMYRKEGLETTLFHRCHTIMEKALEGGKHLTREEINEEFLKLNIKAEGHRLSYLMMQAELEGLICSGIRKGNQFTYALLEERVPRVKLLAKEEALAELTQRYFTSRGPATVKDFATWSGLTLTDCKIGVEAIGSRFNKEKVEGNEYYFVGTTSKCKEECTLYLLPIYDELIMGYKDRSPIMLHKEGLKKPTSFRFDSMILFDGQVVGTWKRAIHSKYIEMEYAFFEPLAKKEMGLFSEAVERLGQFYALEVKAKDKS